jgi:error-prone DNA polymerase
VRGVFVEFLRADLADRRIVTCAEAMEAAGLVLVRQRPGSAKGVIFITIEDETGVANLVVWPSLFERQRRVLSAGMMAVRGKIQRERRSGPSRRPPSDRSVRGSRQRRREGRRFSAAARSRRPDQGRRQLRTRPKGPVAERAPDARHLVPDRALRVVETDDGGAA